MAGANWMLYRSKQGSPYRPAQDARQLPSHDLSFGSNAAASFEISTVQDSEDLSNDIFCLSAKSVSALEHSELNSGLQELHKDLDAALNLSDEDSDDVDARRLAPTLVRTPVKRHRSPDIPTGLPDPSDLSVRHLTPEPLFESRRTTPVPVEIPLSDPFNPEDFSEQKTTLTLAERITQRSQLLSSPYVYRDGSPEARKLTYKVVKGQAPLPPSTPVDQPQPSAPSLNRVVYRRPEKRQAPQPPSIYEHDFWNTVEEEARRPLSITTGGVEAKVRKRQKEDSQKRSSIRSEFGLMNGDINLTFKEKMSRFFGLSGRARRSRSRASFTLSSSSNNNVKFFSNRNTLQSFSYVQSKSFVADNGEPMRENRIDPARMPQTFDPPVQRAWSRSASTNNNYQQRRRPFDGQRSNSHMY